MRRLVVWHNLNKDTYYYKFVSTNYYKYKVGLINQYNHQVVLILDSEEFSPIIKKVSLFSLPINLIIKFLNLIIRFLEKIKNI